MAKGKKGSLSLLSLGTQEFSLLSLAQVCARHEAITGGGRQGNTYSFKYATRALRRKLERALCTGLRTGCHLGGQFLVWVSELASSERRWCS